jgi:hypothetical protein
LILFAYLKDIPGAEVVFQDLNFILGLFLELGTILLERLELVDKLVDDLPEPLVRQVQHNRLVRAQNAVEEVAIVVVGLESVGECK